MKSSKYRLALIDKESGIEIPLPTGSFIAIVNKLSGKSIPEDEPTFIARAKDDITPEVMLVYVARAKVYGCKETLFSTMTEQIREIENWRNNNQNLVRKPD